MPLHLQWIFKYTSIISIPQTEAGEGAAALISQLEQEKVLDTVFYNS